MMQSMRQSVDAAGTSPYLAGSVALRCSSDRAHSFRRNADGDINIIPVMAALSFVLSGA